MNEKYLLMLADMVNRCKEDGGDLDALLDLANTLYRDSVTPLGLKRWKADDKPQMADFNRDNEILDREIRAMKEELQEIKEKLARKADKVENAEWFDLELLNGFHAFSDLIPQYSRVGNVVTMRGFIAHESGVTPLNTVIAVLPSGFRPTKHVISRIIPLSGSGGGGYARCTVNINGEIVINNTDNQTALNANAGTELTFSI